MNWWDAIAAVSALALALGTALAFSLKILARFIKSTVEASTSTLQKDLQERSEKLHRETIHGMAGIQLSIKDLAVKAERHTVRIGGIEKELDRLRDEREMKGNNA